MAATRPISDLRDNLDEIETLCEEQGEVFLTRDGVVAYVLMTMDVYEKLQARLDLYHKLAEAEAEIANGATGSTHEEVIRSLREKYGLEK